MKFQTLKSERGFGLIHTLVVLIIVSISMAGLVFSSAYARYKASENYHTRSALLAVAAKLERIKYDNRGRDQRPILKAHLYTNNTFILDDEEGKFLQGQFEYDRSNAIIDNSVAYFVEYTSITVTLKWKEPGRMFFPPREKQVTLREDYFRRRDI